ncbi:MAG TPA: hypothetical protein VH593_04310 [Ktedonobacteraceae bacterium]|jgi:hypothetical protein
MAATKASKQCRIIRVYRLKENKIETGAICAIIANSRGTQYTTCKHRDGRTSCTCKAGQNGRRCYHVDTLLVHEEVRQGDQATTQSGQEKASKGAEKLAQPQMTSSEARLAAMGMLRGQRSGGKLPA